MITRALHTAYKTARERKWTRVYWAIDIHGTMMPHTHRGNDLPKTFYAHAREVLQQASARKEICLILYTCSPKHEIENYLDFFKANDIHFDYINENPEAENTEYGDYKQKPYFNVLFEDKAGFDPENDWLPVLEWMSNPDALRL
jgi:peptide methionine sulfoxide reductase MsrA